MLYAKFKLLLWKNFIIQKRHWIQAIFEIIFPVLLTLILAWSRSLLDVSTTDQRSFQSFKPLPARYCYWQTFAYSPNNNSAVEKLVQQATKGFNIVGLSNKNDLENYLFNQSESNNAIGIEFQDELANSDSLPIQLHYAIRMKEQPFNSWMTDQLYGIAISQASRGSDDTGGKPPYYAQCFLTLQNNIDRTFIATKSGSSQLPEIKINRFPYPAISEDTFTIFASYIFPLFVVISFFYSTKVVIKNVAIESETQIKETMKIMGLSRFLHWSAWYTKCFIMMSVSFTIMTVLLTTSLATDTGKKAVFEHSNPLLIWIFFAAYCSSIITFCFLISVIIRKSNTAANIGVILFCITYLPYAKFGEKFFRLSYPLKVVFCSVLNSGMGQGITQILTMESKENGLRFSNFFSRDIDLKFSFGEVFICILLGIVFHVLLMIYIEKVFPGEFGIPERWYFPFMPCIRYFKRKLGYNTLSSDFKEEGIMLEENFEQEPSDLKVGIHISNLTKKFDHKVAVNQLNMNMYENQITVLLGHNGAGKTTTMSILTGLFAPTLGTAYIDGKDIRYNIDEARKSMGICPQHNVLFDELTVEEHFKFFCSLKGMRNDRDIKDEINKYLDMLELKPKRYVQTNALSGGMKRKLSIGIALCGKSKIVMVDEASSGLDPSARRALWDLLIEEKKGRTILLTTHFMDEADVLGDRIAIMADGELKTIGSSFFLKKRFGTGYRLICVKNSSCDVNVVLNFLKTLVPDIEFESNVHSELTFILPEEYLPRFSTIFKTIEDNSENLRISSFGCSLTTLEEVFLKIGSDSYSRPNTSDENNDKESNLKSDDSTIDLNEFISPKKVVTGFYLWLYQVQAIILKKFHYLRRNYKSIVIDSILSAWLISVLLGVNVQSIVNIDPMRISFDAYENTISVLEINQGNQSLISSYKNLFSGKDVIEEISTSMENYILNEYNKSIPTVNRKNLIGATISKSSIIAWFNYEPYHTLPLTLNTINRAMLKMLAGNEPDISLENKPYVVKENDDFVGDRDGRSAMLGSVTLSILFFALLTLWSTIFIGFYIKERECRAKLLQLISGTNRIIYWITSFIFDYTIFIVICCALLGGALLFQKPYFCSSKDFGLYLFIFAVYGFSTLPFLYLFSYLFTKHSTGESMALFTGFIFALAYGIYSIAYQLTAKQMTKYLARLFYWIFLCVGPFSIVDIFAKLQLKKFTMEPISLALEKDGIGINLLILVISGILFITICILKDHHWFEQLIYGFLNRFKKLPPTPSKHEQDQDVGAEMERINAMSESQIADQSVVMKGMTKFYGNFLAVNQLSLAVGSSECFGLLGINGAGKTSSFKMLCGDEHITAGDAWVQGNNIKTQLHKVHQLIGYCPQFDALLLDLTGRETLKIFSLLRGISKSEIDSVVFKLATELGFWKHIDKQVKAYSGGNKRKLSTALALIGDPSVIYLDEPSAGMDPGTKRQLWNIIIKTRDSGRSVILTSHSMEEVEALCTRLAIMVNGQFKCLGSTQHLKNKFSKGYILTIKAGHEAIDSEDRMNIIKNELHRLFSSAELKEHYLDILTYHIPTEELKWSEVFGVMENFKMNVGIDDYSLTQTSLDQVFLFFTKSGIYQQNVV